MLRHLASGRREFGVRPMYVHQRANWEFFVVLRGRCAATFDGGTQGRLCRRHLWLFPPTRAHGWTSADEEACEVAVFHFGAVPAIVETLARARGYLERALSAAEANRVAALAAELRPHFQLVTERGLLVMERALLDLSLLALANEPLNVARTRDHESIRKVDAALAWYAEHIAEQPSLPEAARAAHVSVSQLRRLFSEVRHESPQRAFTKLRLQRVMELLGRSDLKLEEIAVRCGFSGSSDLCRVFKAQQGISPDAWCRTRTPTRDQLTG
jgi:AraC family transcriptional regulator